MAKKYYKYFIGLIFILAALIAAWLQHNSYSAVWKTYNAQGLNETMQGFDLMCLPDAQTVLLFGTNDDNLPQQGCPAKSAIICKSNDGGLHFTKQFLGPAFAWDAVTKTEYTVYATKVLCTNTSDFKTVLYRSQNGTNAWDSLLQITGRRLGDFHIIGDSVMIFLSFDSIYQYNRFNFNTGAKSVTPIPVLNYSRVIFTGTDVIMLSGSEINGTWVTNKIYRYVVATGQTDVNILPVGFDANEIYNDAGIWIAGKKQNNVCIYCYNRGTFKLIKTFDTNDHTFVDEIYVHEKDVLLVLSEMSAVAVDYKVMSSADGGKSWKKEDMDALTFNPRCFRYDPTNKILQGVAYNSLGRIMIRKQQN